MKYPNSSTKSIFQPVFLVPLTTVLVAFPVRRFEFPKIESRTLIGFDWLVGWTGKEFEEPIRLSIRLMLLLIGCMAGVVC